MGNLARFVLAGWMLMAAACGDDATPDAAAGLDGAIGAAGTTGGPEGGGSAGGEPAQPAQPIPLDTERFPPGTCEDGFFQLEGTLDGQPYEASGASDDRGPFAGHPFYLFEDAFLTYTGGTAAGAGNEIGGVLKLDESYYCVGPGSMGADNEGEHTVALALHSLGACGDQPVEGEVFSCRGDETECTGETPETSPSAGSIEGVEWLDEGSGHSSRSYRGVVSFGWGAAFFVFDLESPGSVTGVILGGPQHDHAVYCFGEGSTINFGDPDLFHFTSLSKLRSCPTTGTSNIVHGCFN